jgi:hypothetical protein
MKTAWLLGMAMLATQTAHGQECVIVVYANQDAGWQWTSLVWQARGKTTWMFARIGVQMRWRTGQPRAVPPNRGCEAPIAIQFEADVPARFLPGALAYALPYDQSGTRIRVFLNRIATGLDRTSARSLLANVLSHEITHVIQGTSRHSDTGVMKAHFEKDDFQQMKFEPLPFASEDIELIHLGLARWRHAALPVTN